MYSYITRDIFTYVEQNVQSHLLQKHLNGLHVIKGLAWFL